MPYGEDLATDDLLESSFAKCYRCNFPLPQAVSRVVNPSLRRVRGRNGLSGFRSVPASRTKWSSDAEPRRRTRALRLHRSHFFYECAVSLTATSNYFSIHLATCDTLVNLERREGRVMSGGLSIPCLAKSSTLRDCARTISLFKVYIIHATRLRVLGAYGR